jgi:hypothetical protein
MIGLMDEPWEDGMRVYGGDKGGLWARLRDYGSHGDKGQGQGHGGGKGLWGKGPCGIMGDLGGVAWFGRVL